MEIQALWAALFNDEQGRPRSSGVILLRQGHVHGGDSNYHYQGSYGIEDGRLHLTLTATHFHGGRSHVVGDRDAFTLHLSGRTGGDFLVLAGELDDDPGVRVGVEMQRVATLPEVGPATV